VKLAASFTRSLQADMRAELRDIERAASSGTRDAGRGLKTELRRQVSSAGLGQRLANSWRDRHYPNQQLDAASLIYTRAPQIIRAFDEGVVIRSRRGRFLAIPTENTSRKACPPPGGCFARKRPDPRRPRLQPDLRPTRSIDRAVPGVPAIKSAALALTVDYGSDTPLS
jgi:hypothetical protein